MILKQRDGCVCVANVDVAVLQYLLMVFPLVSDMVLLMIIQLIKSMCFTPLDEMVKVHN